MIKNHKLTMSRVDKNVEQVEFYCWWEYNMVQPP